ncbi:MAG: HAD-IA family hydrolase [Nitrospirae bacterium]|nr:HAD-IA family hydrolase [Nitrospirota bacterium]MBI3593989.1 HAD-IA family hydrolase [Nitrospirota bacterium]
MSKLNHPLKVIFFDAAETLFKTRGSVGELYLNAARKHGSTATKREIDDAFFKVFKKEPPPVISSTVSSNERVTLEKAWWYSVVKSVFTEVGMIPSFEDYFQEVYAIFKGSQGWELFPETFEVLTEIKKRGYRTGMITNFDTRVYDVNRALGIDGLIDSLTLSTEAGAPKPDPKIFKKALEHHRIEPAKALHVGDSMSDDVRGAQNAGLQAVLIDRHRLYKQESDYVRIESLTELLEIL